MKVQLPLTRETLEKYKVGDVLELTGYLYTARDAAHKRFAEAVDKGQPLPIDLENETIFYAGPCPTKPGNIIGPIAPTTSVRMDPYVEMMMERGMVATIGKGERSEGIAPLMKKYKGLYLVGIGGTSALIAKSVKSVEVVAYEDLQTESIKRLYVEDMMVMVAIDTQGRILHDEERAKYLRQEMS